MIKKKMIPGIIIFTILIIIIISIIYIYNKKNKENKDNLDKLQKCKQQQIQKVQQYNKNLQGSLNNKQLIIDNLEKQKKADKFKLYKSSYYSGEFQRTKLITSQSLESLAPDIKIGLGNKYSGTKTTQETLEEYIADQKADQKAAKAAENKTKMTEMTIGLLKALYEAFDDNFDTQSCLNLLKTVGMDALNVALACAGLGWICGPLNALVKDLTTNKPAQNPNLFIAQKLCEQLEYDMKNSDISTNLNAVQTQLINVNKFLQTTYPQVKYLDTQVLCPPNVPPNQYCLPASPPNNNKCDFVNQNNDVQKCYLYSNGIPPNAKQYDPSIVTPLLQSVPGYPTKRYYLQNILGALGTSGSATSPISNIVAGPIPNTASGYNSNASGLLDTLYSQTNKQPNQLSYMVNGYPLYIYIIIYTISYYQELALLDTSTDTQGGPYSNPYVSSNISKMYSTLNSLLSFPQTNKGFMTYIMNTFKCYYNQLTFNTHDNGCCNPSDRNTPLSCCSQWGKYNVCTGTWQCDKWTTLDDGFSTLNTVDPKSKRNWYQLISEKYNDNYYSASVLVSIQQNTKGDMKQPSPGDAQSNMTKYLAYFNEYLNFPFDTYLNFAKMAGYTPQTSINGGPSTPSTSTDLFTYMLTILYADNRVPITKPLPKISISFPSTQDASKGYPFGLDKPSYAEAYSAVQNFNPSPTLEDIDHYNTYGTPAYSIEPGASFNATMFNIPGDVKYGSYSTGTWICADGLADNIRSALLPGASPGLPGANPGKTDSATPNSRQTYCINTKTGKLSNLIPYNPNQNYGPSFPPAGKLARVWEINANNQLYRLQAINGHIGMNDGPFTNWNNSGGSSTWNFSLSDGTTGHLVFDSNSYITDGYISLFQPTTTPGQSTTPGPYTTPKGTARPWSTTPVPTTTYSPSKSGSITNFITNSPPPITYYDANMPVAAAGTNKLWIFTLGGTSYNLTLDSTGAYYLNNNKLSNLQNWNLTIVSTGTFSGIFGYNESLIFYNVGNNYSYTPVNYTTVTLFNPTNVPILVGPPSKPPAGSNKLWKTSVMNGQNKLPLTFSMDSNGNFMLISSVAPIVLNGSFVDNSFNYNGKIPAGGIVINPINISGSLIFDVNGNLISPSNISPYGPLIGLPVAGIISTSNSYNQWTFSVSVGGVANITVNYSLYQDTNGIFYIQNTTTPSSNFTFDNGLYKVLTDPSLNPIVNLNLGWNGNTMTFIDCTGANQGSIIWDSATNPAIIQGGRINNIMANRSPIGSGTGPINNTPVKSTQYTGNLNFSSCGDMF